MYRRLDSLWSSDLLRNQLLGPENLPSKISQILANHREDTAISKQEDKAVHPSGARPNSKQSLQHLVVVQIQKIIQGRVDQSVKGPSPAPTPSVDEGADAGTGPSSPLYTSLPRSQINMPLNALYSHYIPSPLPSAQGMTSTPTDFAWNMIDRQRPSRGSPESRSSDCLIFAIS